MPTHRKFDPESNDILGDDDRGVEITRSPYDPYTNLEGDREIIDNDDEPIPTPRLQQTHPTVSTSQKRSGDDAERCSSYFASTGAVGVGGRDGRRRANNGGGRGGGKKSRGGRRLSTTPLATPVPNVQGRGRGDGGVRGANEVRRGRSASTGRVSAPDHGGRGRGRGGGGVRGADEVRRGRSATGRVSAPGDGGRGRGRGHSGGRTIVVVRGRPGDTPGFPRDEGGRGALADRSPAPDRGGLDLGEGNGGGRGREPSKTRTGLEEGLNILEGKKPEAVHLKAAAADLVLSARENISMEPFYRASMNAPKKRTGYKRVDSGEREKVCQQ